MDTPVGRVKLTRRRSEPDPAAVAGGGPWRRMVLRLRTWRGTLPTRWTVTLDGRDLAVLDLPGARHSRWVRGGLGSGVAATILDRPGRVRLRGGLFRSDRALVVEGEDALTVLRPEGFRGRRVLRHRGWEVGRAVRGRWEVLEGVPEQALVALVLLHAVGDHALDSPLWELAP
ncbi:hypothetical protein ACN20G_26885 (plasmid) [Streptomyces sp. BI20]|uniref:hypothetical protein n=1 Tax=Streptomyces sp. BI20 TaxID=3403460 RepID=UPI003C722140